MCDFLSVTGQIEDKIWPVALEKVLDCLVADIADEKLLLISKSTEMMERTERSKYERR